jgi:hypothetical protein
MMGLDDVSAGLAQLMAFGNVICIVYALLHKFVKAQPRPVKDVVEFEYGKMNNDTWVTCSALATNTNKIMYSKQVSYYKS